MPIAVTSYLLLAGSVALVLFWVHAILLRWLFSNLRNYRVYRANIERGKEIQARILESTYMREVRAGRPAPITLKLQFQNFAGTDITQTLRFLDTKPDQRRFPANGTARLLINPQAPPGKRIVMAGSQAYLSPRFFLIWGALATAAGFGLYLAGRALWTRAGQNPEGLLALFDRPELLQLLGLLCGVALLVFVVFRLVSRSLTGKNTDELRYHGRRATAQITGLEETGMRVNHQPQIRFTYSFQTPDGKTHTGESKQIVRLIDIGGVRDIKTKEILYLPDDPARSAFAETVLDGDEAGTSIMLTILWYFISLIFSAVFLGNLWSALMK